MISSEPLKNVHSNEKLIVEFYKAFQAKDFKTMQASYDEDAVFSDEVFKSLDATEVKMMWEMLISRGKDLELTFSNVEANEIKGDASWTATYTFSSTGRKVVNHVSSRFIFHEGRIIQHTDNFDFYMWAKQAFGPMGFILGWTNFFRKKVSKEASQQLRKFIDKKEQSRG